MNERRENASADLTTVRHHIETAIKAAVSEHDSRKESLLLAVYDAVSLRPGVFGVSIDLKRLLEHFIPDVRAKLSGRATKRDGLQLLKPFVTPSGHSHRVSVAEAEALLGRSTVDALVASTILFRVSQDHVVLTHDLIAQFIHRPESFAQ